MSRILKRNTLVRKNGAFGDLVPLYAGQELPDWAEGLVGDHLFEDGTKAPETHSKKKLPLPEATPEPVEEPEEVEVPHRGAHHTKWRKFLEAGGVAVQPGTSREEMIDIAEDNFPGIEIPNDEE